MYVLLKKPFLLISVKKNRDLFVNLTFLVGFFAITRTKIIAAKFRTMKKMPVLYLCRQKVTYTTNSSTVKFEKPKKC